MKKAIFVDTAAWLALINKSDILHKKAKQIRDNLIKKNRHFLLTDYIIVEIANALSRAPFRKAAVQVITLIKSSRNTRVVEIDKEIFIEAWQKYGDAPYILIFMTGERQVRTFNSITLTKPGTSNTWPKTISLLSLHKTW